jgi:hypothetical protein
VAADLPYIRTHLAHVFDQMLASTTTWAGCRPSRRRKLPVDLVVMAEYSAFLHQRCLYELACEPKGSRFRKATTGSTAALRTDAHTNWYDHLNTAVAHVYGRGPDADPVDGAEHLKDQVAVLALDLLRVFDRIKSKAPDDVADALDSAIATGLRKSATVVERMQLPPLDWSLDDPFVYWGAYKWWPAEDDPT